MDMAIASTPPRPGWWQLARPREHGSYSLALEPLLLGLLAYPSWPGMLVATTALAGFLARRPLRLWLTGKPADRQIAQVVLLGLGSVMAVALSLTVALTGVSWMAWLLPTGLAAILFLHFDLQGNGREGTAELAGAAAFAWLPAVLAILAGTQPTAAAAIAIVVAGRSLPTVLVVRARLQGQRRGSVSVEPALFASTLALVLTAIGAHLNLAPAAAVAFSGLFLMRAVVVLNRPLPRLRARQLGMIEAVLGTSFVLVCALTWPAT